MIRTYALVLFTDVTQNAYIFTNTEIDEEFLINLLIYSYIRPI